MHVNVFNLSRCHARLHDHLKLSIWPVQSDARTIPRAIFAKWMAISWQLRGLHGNYGIYMVVTGCTWQSSSIKRHVYPHNSHVDTIIATLSP